MVVALVVAFIVGNIDSFKLSGSYIAILRKKRTWLIPSPMTPFFFALSGYTQWYWMRVINGPSILRETHSMEVETFTGNHFTNRY